MVNIPSDLRKNKETIIGNMDLRESICLFLGLIFAVSILYYIRVFLGFNRILIAAFIAGLFAIPFLLIGFKKIYGMKLDDYFKVYVNNKIIANTDRLLISKNNELVVKNKKYEIIRYYRLKNKKDILVLRKYLIDKNLILTEYIDYRDEQYVIFRIDGKELMLEEIRKNKEEIKNKTKEIKNFAKQVKEERKNKNAELFMDSNIKLKELKEKKKYLQNKTFNDLKDEVDIFGGLENIEIEKLNTILLTKFNKKAESLKDDSITNLYFNIKNDERTLCQLNLFDIDYFREFLKHIKDKIVFINKEDEVDVYFYDNKLFNELEIIVDLNYINKNTYMYKGTINLEARNYYNCYRKIHSLEEIFQIGFKETTT